MESYINCTSDDIIPDGSDAEHYSTPREFLLGIRRLLGMEELEENPLPKKNRRRASREHLEDAESLQTSVEDAVVKKKIKRKKSRSQPMSEAIEEVVVTEIVEQAPTATKSCLQTVSEAIEEVVVTEIVEQPPTATKELDNVSVEAVKSPNLPVVEIEPSEIVSSEKRKPKQTPKKLKPKIFKHVSFNLDNNIYYESPRRPGFPAIMPELVIQLSLNDSLDMAFNNRVVEQTIKKAIDATHVAFKKPTKIDLTPVAAKLSTDIKVNQVALDTQPTNIDVPSVAAKKSTAANKLGMKKVRKNIVKKSLKAIKLKNGSMKRHLACFINEMVLKEFKKVSPYILRCLDRKMVKRRKANVFHVATETIPKPSADKCIQTEPEEEPSSPRSSPITSRLRSRKGAAKKPPPPVKTPKRKYTRRNSTTTSTCTKRQQTLHEVVNNTSSVVAPVPAEVSSSTMPKKEFIVRNYREPDVFLSQPREEESDVSVDEVMPTPPPAVLDQTVPLQDLQISAEMAVETTSPTNPFSHEMDWSDNALYGIPVKWTPTIIEYEDTGVLYFESEDEISSTSTEETVDIPCNQEARKKPFVARSSDVCADEDPYSFFND